MRINARKLQECYRVAVIQRKNPLVFPRGDRLPTGHQFTASHTQLRVDRVGSERQGLAIRDQSLLDVLGLEVQRGAPKQVLNGLIRGDRKNGLFEGRPPNTHQVPAISERHDHNDSEHDQKSMDDPSPAHLLMVAPYRACIRSAHLLMAAPYRACIRSAHLLMAAPYRACIRSAHLLMAARYRACIRSAHLRQFTNS